MLLLSNAARRWLLDLARAGLAAAARQQPLPDSQPPPELSLTDREELRRPRGAFVSLHKQGQLRGCVGHIGFDVPLFRLVPEMARAAAREDSRFDPIGSDELADIDVEVSVLSPFFPIRQDEVLPGVHGLMVRQGAHHGLLLPQVASSHNWDSVRFLQETCRKAGLPTDAWQHGAEVKAFTADIINESPVHPL